MIDCYLKFQSNCDEPIESLFNLVKLEFECCQENGIDASYEPSECDCEAVLWQKWVKIKACCGCSASCFGDLPNYVEGELPTFIAALNADNCLVKLPSDTNLDEFIEVVKDVVTGQTKIGFNEEDYAEWLVCNFNAAGIEEVDVADAVRWLGLDDQGCIVSFEPISFPILTFNGNQSVENVPNDFLQNHSFNFPASGVYQISVSYSALGPDVNELQFMTILPGGVQPLQSVYTQNSISFPAITTTWTWTYPAGVQNFCETYHSSQGSFDYTHFLKIIIWRLK